MSTEVFGMRAAISGGTQDAAASMDIPQDGTITGLDWDLGANLDADGEVIDVELSFIATNQITQNDVRGRISSIGVQMSLTTSGVATTSVQKFVGPMDVIVSGGERLYLHSVSTAGVGGNVRCNIHFDTVRPAVRRSARRR